MGYETNCLTLFYQELSTDYTDPQVCKRCGELAQSLKGAQPREIEEALEQIGRLNPVNIPLTRRNSALAVGITTICVGRKKEIREGVERRKMYYRASVVDQAGGYGWMTELTADDIVKARKQNQDQSSATNYHITQRIEGVKEVILVLSEKPETTSFSNEQIGELTKLEILAKGGK